MLRDNFAFRKKNQLGKIDKSLKQSIDKKIKKLCDLINKNPNYYTTSSCSGRIVLIKESKEKTEDLFLFVSHDLVKFEELKKELAGIKYEDLVYFKQDPVILHVACRTLNDAQKLHDFAKWSGWKRCGIIATKKRFMVELNGTHKIEMPIMNNGKILVDDKFLEILVNESNKKLEKSWSIIKNLEKLI
ncbi:MAG: tRNA wybutosine-synthesizing 3 family protein [Candidatus Pacearchaeota archaeon]